jgi:hypothetical protein
VFFKFEVFVPNTGYPKINVTRLKQIILLILPVIRIFIFVDQAKNSFNPPVGHIFIFGDQAKNRLVPPVIRIFGDQAKF